MYKAPITNTELTNEQLFWLCHTWKLEPEQIAQLDNHLLASSTAGKIAFQLNTSDNGNMLSTYVPIYQYCTKAQILKDPLHTKYWISFRTLGKIKVALIQRTRNP